VARAFLTRRHFLAPPRSLPAGPESVLAVIDRLGSLQFDPLDVAGRNHDLVLLSRIDGYRREWTDALLYDERALFEAHNKGLSLLPTSELPWYRLTWDRKRERHERETFQEHAPLVEELIGRIRAEGRLSSIDFEARAAIDWYWRPTNQVRAILEALAESGVLGLAGRRGNRRYYDLAERLFPEALLARREDPWSQRRHRLLSRYRAHGLLGRSGSAELWLGAAPGIRKNGYEGPTRGELIDDLEAQGDLVAVEIDGIRGTRYVPGIEIPALDQAEAAAAERTDAPGQSRDNWTPPDPSRAGVAFLAPLDPFVWDRDFLRKVFGFDYVWEVYVPERKRRWGYYVLPILWGDRLVGRIEPRIDRRADALRVLNVWWEAGFEPGAHPYFIDGLAAALEAHRAFGDVGRILLPRGAAVAPLRDALRQRLPAPGRARDRPGGTGPGPANRGTIRGRASSPAR